MKKVPKSIVEIAPKGTIWSGGSVDRIIVTLRIKSNRYSLLELEKLLGPSDSREFPTVKHWSSKATPTRTGNIDKQIKQIFTRIKLPIKQWDELKLDCDIDLFCGVFMERINRGFEISKESIDLLSKYSVRIGFDIYTPNVKSRLNRC